MIYDFQDEFFHSCQQMMLPRIFLVMLDLSSSEGPLGPPARRPILGKASFQEERVKSVDWVIFFFTAAVTRILMCHMWKKNDNFGTRGGGWRSLMDVWLCTFTCIRDSIEIMLVGVLASLQAGEYANKCCIYSFCDTEECILKHPSDRPPPQHTEVSLLSRPAGSLSPSQEHLHKPRDSSARYPVVPLLRRPSEGRTGGWKLSGRNSIGLTFRGVKSCLLRTKSAARRWFQSKGCFGELMWLHALHSDNKKILILFLGRYSICIRRAQRHSEVRLNKAQKTTLALR